VPKEVRAAIVHVTAPATPLAVPAALVAVICQAPYCAVALAAAIEAVAAAPCPGGSTMVPNACAKVESIAAPSPNNETSAADVKGAAAALDVKDLSANGMLAIVL